jgi:hypothetical protein
MGNVIGMTDLPNRYLDDVRNPWQFLGDVLPGLGCILECVQGMSPSEPGAPRRKKHGKIVLRVA